MKITSTQYARVLHEITKNKSQKDIDGAIYSFAEILNRNNQLKLKKDIAAKFNEVYNKENGIIEAEITSREKLSEDLRKYVSKYVSTRYNAKEVILSEKVDDSIKGGIIIRIGDEVMDASVEKQLADLEKVLTK